MDDLPFLTNKQISDKYELEQSLVSRVRSKGTWKQIWIAYEKRATTIENTPNEGGSE
jgi:hypothetical protein